MTDLDGLLAEMREVLDALDALDESDPEREALVAKQEDIRSRLRALDYDRHRPRAEVEAELRHLYKQLKSARGDRIKTIKGRFTGADLAVGGRIPATDINERIDASNQVSAIENRIEALERVLRDG
ncbi:MAG: hypothetical protein KJO36_13420 [Acidimicrobiia bacterium]|nr:hypothetical protein [Acidimicrobiia bacterium]NNC43164.1 hypothetical protein [Acidimicrobiia bacterium]NNL47592.1 hypothetical protein [Acidimicrobiia bacterium]